MCLDSLIKELEQIIIFYRLPEADFAWSTYDAADDAIIEMQSIISSLLKGDTSVLARLTFLFAPTSDIGEIAISSGWADEYLEISSKVESLITIIKREKKI